MKTLISTLFISSCLFACKTVPTVKYSPPLKGQEDPQGLVPAGEPLTAIDINWYAVLFYATVVLWLIWLYFRNEGGEDKNHDGFIDTSEVKGVEEGTTNSVSVNNVSDGTSK
jgi:hypothetical protein